MTLLVFEMEDNLSCIHVYRFWFIVDILYVPITLVVNFDLDQSGLCVYELGPCNWSLWG